MRDGPITEADLAESLKEHDKRMATHRENQRVKLQVERSEDERKAGIRRQKAINKATKIARRRATKKAIKRGHCTITR